MESGLWVNCSTPFLVASRSDATPWCRSGGADSAQLGGPSLRDGHSQSSQEIKQSGACEGGEWKVAFG